MTYFVETYLSDKKNENLSIMDLGSCDICGSYHQLFEHENWRYTGLDLEPGKNVDIVLQSPYNWTEILDASVDIFISGQAFEHIEFFWLTMLEIKRVMKPGALCCIIAPSGGYEHRYPLDCWRFYPDGFRALARYAGIETLETIHKKDHPQYTDESALWSDTVFIGRKPLAGETCFPGLSDSEMQAVKTLSEQNQFTMDYTQEILALSKGLAHAEKLAFERQDELNTIKKSLVYKIFKLFQI